MDLMTREVTDWWPVRRADALVALAVSLGWEPDGPLRYQRLCDTSHWQLRFTSGERWMRVGVLGWGITTPIVGEEAGGPSGVRVLGGDAVSAWIAKDAGRDYRRACRPCPDATRCLNVMMTAGWQVQNWWRMFSSPGEMGSQCRLVSPRGTTVFLSSYRLVSMVATPVPRGGGKAVIPLNGKTAVYDSADVRLTGRNLTRLGRERVTAWVEGDGRDW